MIPDRILITGGLGYLGGRMATYLREKHPGTDIVLTTRTGRIPEWARRFEVVPMDLEHLTNEMGWLHGVDVIIHLASMHQEDCARNPKKAFNVNTVGVYDLLDVAVTKEVTHVIYFSTFHVYGSPGYDLLTEESPTRPFHPYATTHRAAEDVVRYFTHYKGVQSLIFRGSNGYGYPMDTDISQWMLVFNDFCRQAVTTGRIIINSSGKQHRNVISLKDMSRAVEHFLFNPDYVWQGDMYNLAGEQSLSIYEIAQRVAERYRRTYGKNIEDISARENGHSVEQSRPVHISIDKLKTTGFQLTEDMDLEIDKTLEICERFVKGIHS